MELGYAALVGLRVDFEMLGDVVDDVIFVLLLNLRLVVALVVIRVEIFERPVDDALRGDAFDERVVVEDVEADGQRFVVVEVKHVEVARVMAGRVRSLNDRPIFYLKREG